MAISLAAEISTQLGVDLVEPLVATVALAGLAEVPAALHQLALLVGPSLDRVITVEITVEVRNTAAVAAVLAVLAVILVVQPLVAQVALVFLHQ